MADHDDRMRVRRPILFRKKRASDKGLHTEDIEIVSRNNSARRTALIQVNMVALAPIPSAKVTTTVRANPGRLSSVRTVYRRSCQKISIIYTCRAPAADRNHGEPSSLWPKAHWDQP